MFEWIRFIVGVLLLICGLVIFFMELFGMFRFHYVLNRMHAAAAGDTLGIGISLLGVICFEGFNFVSLKLFLVILFLWLASPVSSHLLARLEVITNPDLGEHCDLSQLKDKEV